MSKVNSPLQQIVVPTDSIEHGVDKSLLKALKGAPLTDHRVSRYLAGWGEGKTVPAYFSNKKLAGEKQAPFKGSTVERVRDIYKGVYNTAKSVSLAQDDKLPWEYDTKGKLLSTELDAMKFKINYLKNIIGLKNEDKWTVDINTTTNEALDDLPDPIRTSMIQSCINQLIPLEMEYAQIKAESSFRQNLINWMLGEGPSKEYKKCWWIQMHPDEEDFNKSLQELYSEGERGQNLANQLAKERKKLMDNIPGFTRGVIEKTDRLPLRFKEFKEELARNAPKTDEGKQMAALFCDSFMICLNQTLECFLWYKYIVLDEEPDFDYPFHEYYWNIVRNEHIANNISPDEKQEVIDDNTFQEKLDNIDAGYDPKEIDFSPDSEIILKRKKFRPDQMEIEYHPQVDIKEVPPPLEEEAPHTPINKKQKDKRNRRAEKEEKLKKVKDGKEEIKIEQPPPLPYRPPEAPKKELPAVPKPKPPKKPTPNVPVSVAPPPPPPIKTEETEEEELKRLEQALDEAGFKDEDEVGLEKRLKHRGRKYQAVGALVDDKAVQKILDTGFAKAASASVKNDDIAIKAAISEIAWGIGEQVAKSLANYISNSKNPERLIKSDKLYVQMQHLLNDLSQRKIEWSEGMVKTTINLATTMYEDAKEDEEKRKEGKQEITPRTLIKGFTANTPETPGTPEEFKYFKKLYRAWKRKGTLPAISSGDQLLGVRHLSIQDKRKRLSKRLSILDLKE
jgi:hypothetical protein